MKAAFNILPVKTANELLYLLIEIGNYGISFIWYSKDPTDIKGLAVYNFTNVITAGEMATEIDTILKSNPIFEEANTAVTICYDVKESLLVPGEYQKDKTGKAMLELICDADNRSDFKTDHITGINIFNEYAVDKRIATLLTDKFPTATFQHSSSLQLKKTITSGVYIRCIIFHNCIKVFLYREGTVLFVQQFSYIKPVDVAYHLLNCCEQYQLSASSIDLQLSGMIDAHSNLYNELYKYFLNISFDQEDQQINAQERIKFYPSHFFSHLTALVSCVS